jgi:hypothetical protein
MHTLEINRGGQKTGNLKPETGNPRPKKPSGLYRMPLLGGPICRALTTSRARKKIETSEVSPIKGLRVFAKEAEKVMMEGGDWNGSLPDVRSRAKLSAYYAKKIAEKCVALGLKGANESLIRLTEFISPYTTIGLYFMPKEMTRYEDHFGDPLPANLRTGLRGYPSLSLEFLRRFDEQSIDMARAAQMIEHQNVAYDGKGSYNSPSYPTERKGHDLPIEVQLTKLVNTFSAVLMKLMKTDGNPDNPEHTNLAAATMVSVSGKDVNPKLTAVLLTILYPQVTFDDALLLVGLLKHPDQKALEKKPGKDIEYAKQLLSDAAFKDLENAELKAKRAAQRKKERQRKRERARFVSADTLQLDFGTLASGGNKPPPDEWDQDTVPEHKWQKRKAN